MSDRTPDGPTRDIVLNYRPGPESEAPLQDGEPVLAVFEADRRTYWRDHAVMAGFGLVAVAVVLPLVGRADQIPMGALAVIAAMLFRAMFFKSEQFARRWRLTDRRLIGPSGRQVMLLEIKAVRRLLGDVQIVTTSGEKHLMKYLPDASATIATILAARDRRKEVAA